MAFGVTQLAVINETDEPFPAVNSSLDVFEINGVADLSGSIIAIEQGKFENHRAVTFPDDAWILFGGDMGIIGVDADFYTIPTPVALYPREAAAIVLENQWQLRL